ncbi:TlyA family RNA methyltransferase [Oceanibacterium hippocampi]|uniref:16S/23S rRNA (Cytidine-2'-O)-methyltransferase TlyA n=1 Tax=Oceanibacterium hippocampi TaxID=745714 RepID=A0A1Y5TUA9_9PROT|nr:TlyA family RNA methyltransferase [Oceanibacterium hippocampi]SLN72933.1 16S/23S rRNA (cytidine-2'-O)-methyltransferase TlyA [Oceanibacterium hippocampi]
MSERERLDLLLVARGLAPSRVRAQAMIAAGRVRVDGRTAEKANLRPSPDCALDIRPSDDDRWVSRAALKLRHGLAHFRLDPAGRVALDIGASTGGFCQVLLEGGARRVYAVDVGHGQLVPALRADPRIVTLEGVNARDLGPAQVPEAVDVVTCDASFIGLAKVLPPALALAVPAAFLVALIKPQFEAGPDARDRHGVVRDPARHDAVCEAVRDWLGGQAGWHVLGITDSPIAGGDGNREFLIAAELKASDKP